MSAALDCDGSERARYLDEACAGDEALRREVESLLHATLAAEALFEMPAGALSTADVGGLQIGASIGAYRLVSALGAGGMGAVYLAERLRWRPSPPCSRCSKHRRTRPEWVVRISSASSG